MINLKISGVVLLFFFLVHNSYSQNQFLISKIRQSKSKVKFEIEVLKKGDYTLSKLEGHYFDKKKKYDPLEHVLNDTLVIYWTLTKKDVQITCDTSAVTYFIEGKRVVVNDTLIKGQKFNIVATKDKRVKVNILEIKLCEKSYYYDFREKRKKFIECVCE